jgi:hypothetical protein
MPHRRLIGEYDYGSVEEGIFDTTEFIKNSLQNPKPENKPIKYQVNVSIRYHKKGSKNCKCNKSKSHTKQKKRTKRNKNVKHKSKTSHFQNRQTFHTKLKSLATT